MVSQECVGVLDVIKCRWLTQRSLCTSVIDPCGGTAGKSWSDSLRFSFGTCQVVDVSLSSSAPTVRRGGVLLLALPRSMNLGPSPDSRVASRHVPSHISHESPSLFVASVPGEWEAGSPTAQNCPFHQYPQLSDRRSAMPRHSRSDGTVLEHTYHTF